VLFGRSKYDEAFDLVYNVFSIFAQDDISTKLRAAPCRLCPKSPENSPFAEEGLLSSLEACIKKIVIVSNEILTSNAR
jgi:hypothetical protein